MKVLIAGESNEVLSYRTWIADSFEVETGICRDLDECQPLFARNHWDVLILECFRDHEKLTTLVGELNDLQPQLRIVVVCEDAPETAINAMKMGISDYLTAPLSRERLVRSIREIWATIDTHEPGDGKKQKMIHGDNEAGLPWDMLFSGSTTMVAIGDVVTKIVDADLPVLITGESGTGKEMVARYIWESAKRKGPFVRINCSAIPSELIESELFGYEKGAFTGAYSRKPGKFEAADGGFILLDEISELPYAAQSKLLHVLQDGGITSLGSTKELSFDVRIVASTNLDLESCVKKGSFREDLFFRLNVVHLHLPPLRERIEQLDSLIDFFSDKYSVQYGTAHVQLTSDTRSLLHSYPWPGNVRELENVIRKATILGSEEAMHHVTDTRVNEGAVEHDRSRKKRTFPEGELQQVNPVVLEDKKGTESVTPGEHGLKEIGKKAALAAEKEAISRVLQQTRWNRKKAAEILEVSYKTLLTKIKETGLDEN